MASRLPSGGRIDRSRPLRFSFDGKTYHGFHGDTLASALLANDVRLVGRSFKYHRPRGILSAGSEEPNALVELRSGARREPNTRATTVELYDGLEATSQNRWPSLRFDLLSMTAAAVAVHGRGLLLQDLHVAGALLGKALRADDPPRCGAWPRRRRAGSGSLREGFPALRRAGDRRRPGGPCCRARCRSIRGPRRACATKASNWVAAFCRSGMRHRRCARGRMACVRQSRTCAPCPTSG